MDSGQKKTGKNNNASQHEPNVLPATEVVKNPNPRANENVRERTEDPATDTDAPTSGVGSEITDGEDA
jgi:hypothetical protein